MHLFNGPKVLSSESDKVNLYPKTSDLFDLSSSWSVHKLDIFVPSKMIRKVIAAVILSVTSDPDWMLIVVLVY